MPGDNYDGRLADTAFVQRLSWYLGRLSPEASEA
jgi:hypothetical protein